MVFAHSRTDVIQTGKLMHGPRVCRSPVRLVESVIAVEKARRTRSCGAPEFVNQATGRRWPLSPQRASAGASW